MTQKTKTNKHKSNIGRGNTEPVQKQPTTYTRGLRFVAFLLIIGVVGIGASLAFNMKYAGVSAENRPNYNPEVHEKLTQAIESGDYEAWRAIREEYNLPMRGKMFHELDEESFQNFAELHRAVMDGDVERARELRQSFGVKEYSRGKCVSEKARMWGKENRGKPDWAGAACGDDCPMNTGGYMPNGEGRQRMGKALGSCPMFG